jgi:hypothetical protein
MNLLNLPRSTIVNRNIPKNAFDKHTNTRQKRVLTDTVSKISWVNKISPETVNLPANDIHEIQVFEILLKEQKDIATVLQVIDKAIPYHIIFVQFFQEQISISASKKHPHPTSEDNAVIDWTFCSGWRSRQNLDCQLNLKKSIDYIFSDLCAQLSGYMIDREASIEDIIARDQKIYYLRKDIDLLKTSIRKSPQFNLTVELNLELKHKESQLRAIVETKAYRNE